MARELRSTRINTVGGFLKRGNATILVGVEDERVEDVLSVLRENARGGPEARGAGTAMVIDVARFVRM